MFRSSQLLSTSSPLPFSRREVWAFALAAPGLLGPIWCQAFGPGMGLSGTLTGFVLISLLIVCTITDLQNHKIYNWATYTAILWAFALNGVSFFIDSRMLGTVGLTSSLAGASLCGALTLMGFHMSGGGAGDFKLAVSIGALMGVTGFYAVGAAYVVAAGAILIWTAWRHGPLVLLLAGFRKVLARIFPRKFQVTALEQRLLLKPVPLAPYFAIGTLLVVLHEVI